MLRPDLRAHDFLVAESKAARNDSGIALRIGPEHRADPKVIGPGRFGANGARGVAQLAPVVEIVRVSRQPQPRRSRKRHLPQRP